MERTCAGKKKKDETEAMKTAAYHHSFSVPLDYEAMLDDWVVSGASLAERERLLIHPSVPERAAFVWNKLPLLTNDFEATVHLRVVGPKGLDQLVKDQSFAFWYVYGNASAGYNETQLIKAPSWKAGLEEQGMTLSGSKNKFTGLGVFLSWQDAQGNAKPSASAVWNDGSRDITYGKDVPTADSKKVDFRNTVNAAQLKVRVTPHLIEGFFKQSPSLSWNPCFKIDRANEVVKPGGYLGFSAWSGTGSSTTVSDSISVMQLEVFNYDTTSIGEDMKDVSKDIEDAYRNMLLDEKRHFVDQKSQTEHLDRLTNMLKQHVETNKPADEKMFQDLETLQGRMGKLDQECKTMVKELQILVKEKNADGSDKADSAPPDGALSGALKDHVIGIRRVLMKDSAAHQKKMEMVQVKMKEVKQKHEEASKPEMFDEVINHSDRLQDTVAASTSQSSWLLLGIVAAVIVIGFLMYNRMQYYERKHFL